MSEKCTVYAEDYFDADSPETTEDAEWWLDAHAPPAVFDLYTSTKADCAAEFARAENLKKDWKVALSERDDQRKRAEKAEAKIAKVREECQFIANESAGARYILTILDEKEGK